MIRPLLTLVLAAGAFTAAPAPAPVDDTPSPGTFASTAQDNLFLVSGSRPGSGEAGATQARAFDPWIERRKPIPYCGSQGALIDGQACIAETGSGLGGRMCADGSRALDPLWRRPVDPVTGLFAGPWEQVDNGGCPEDPGNQVVLSGAEFARLPLVASGVHLQPEDGRGLVNMPLIVFTDPEPQTLATTVLGVAVTVVATPVSYRWDFGDGTSLTTTDPGRPYPDHTTTGMYTAPGEFAVTLTTTWTGTYQVAGAGPWHPVAGTATTTSAPVATTAIEAHTHLVAEP